MLLSDEGILERIRAGDIELVDPSGQPVIDPTTGREREPGQLQAHGYNLRVNKVFSWGTSRWIELADGESYTIKPGEFVVIGTFERIRLSRNVAATIHAMARMTLSGLCHISTTIHPGWSEQEPEPRCLMVAVYNISKVPVAIERRQRFCRLLFYDVSSPAKRSAPSLEMVTKHFRRIRSRMQPRYARINAFKVGGIYAIIVGIAATILLFVELYLPPLQTLAIAIVIPLLSFTLRYCQGWYGS